MFMAIDLATAVGDFWIARKHGEFFLAHTTTSLHRMMPIVSNLPWSTDVSPPESVR